MGWSMESTSSKAPNLVSGSLGITAEETVCDHTESRLAKISLGLIFFFFFCKFSASKALALMGRGQPRRYQPKARV